MIPVIINATSGTGHSESAFENLRRLFDELGVQVQIIPARDGEHLQQHARRLMKSSPPLIVVGGGDGTISSIAQITRGTGTALGILPMGTLNHFARDLALPIGLREAVNVAVAGRRISIDMGEVNGMPFLNNASIGVYPDLVRDRLRQQRRLGRSKRAAMAWAILAAMRRTPKIRMRIEVDGETRQYSAPFVFVGNNAYLMEGFQIGTRASLEDGELSVYTTRRTTAAGLFRLAIRAIFHRLHQAEDFIATQARRLTVEMKHRRVLVATDGEVRAMDTPLEFRCLPRTLLVMAPHAEAAA
jgi:YegS/Rv2252/BmrU family lipid kinase